MMMKLINAAAGQSVGDEVYYVKLHTNTFRLAKIDFDAGTITYGPNKSDGTYGDPNSGGNNAQPDNLSHYSYSSQSNGSSFVGITSGLTAILQDTSPALGGNLDCNDRNLTEVGTVSGNNLQMDFGTLS